MSDGFPVSVAGREETPDEKRERLVAEMRKRQELNGGSQELPKTTELEKKDTPESKAAMDTVIDKIDPASLQSPSQEEADKAKDSIVTETKENPDGTKTFFSAMSAEALQEHKDKAAAVPVVSNETERLTGFPLNVDKTQGGRLNGDGSMRDPRSLEDINKEINERGAGNPIPLRNGNEATRMMNGILPSTFAAIDVQTSAMAGELAKIRETASLSAEDKATLERIESQLRSTGKV